MGSLVCLLWSIGKGLVEKTRFALKPDDWEMQTYNVSHHSTFIVLPQPQVSTKGIIDSFPSSSDSIFDQMTAIISRITEALDTTHKLKTLEIKRDHEKYKMKKR